MRKGISNRTSNVVTTRPILKTLHNLLASNRSLSVNKSLISFESQIPHETRLVLFLVKFKIGTTRSFHRDFPFEFQTTIALRGFCYEKYPALRMDKGVQVFFLFEAKKSVCFCTFFQNQFDHKVYQGICLPAVQCRKP